MKKGYHFLYHHPNQAYNQFMIVTNKFFSLNIPRFIIGVLLIVPGAFMIADAILVRLGEGVIFFSGVNTNFEGMVGFALIILSASNLDSNR